MSRAGAATEKPTMGRKSLIPVDVKLDWRAYWENFKAAHGDPVGWKGVMLFPDGWTYGMSYGGPEYPPPLEEMQLKRLQLAYWVIRRGMVRAERSYMAATVDELRELQGQRSMPLVHRVESSGPMELDVGMMTAEDGRLAWLTQDLDDCNERIKELKEGLTSAKK